MIGQGQVVSVGLGIPYRKKRYGMTRKYFVLRRECLDAFALPTIAYRLVDVFLLLIAHIMPNSYLFLTRDYYSVKAMRIIHSIIADD
jgi:hypothetical protein